MKIYYMYNNIIKRKMDLALRLMREKHKENFRLGFVHKNKYCMAGENFSLCENVVQNKSYKGRRELPELLQDIGVYFVSNTAVFLRELLPCPNNLLDYNFTIEKGDHVFFEISTQFCNVWDNPTEYIKAKIDFHKKSNWNYNWDIDSDKHLLILVYNGADSVFIGKIFSKLCKSNGIRGTIVHISYDTVSHWDLTLQIEDWKNRTLSVLSETDDEEEEDLFRSVYDFNEYVVLIP
jgi:hypothetical protein